MNTVGQYRILLVEDEDTKRNQIKSVLVEYFENSIIEFAESQIDAQKRIENESWDLIILDISLRISSLENAKITQLPNDSFAKNEIGGLNITKRMQLLRISKPTIVLTGLDYFRRSDAKKYEGERYDLEELSKRLKDNLGDDLLAVIKYGMPNWKTMLNAELRKNFIK